MGKSPLILAALAKDAAPQLDFTRVEPFGSPDGPVDTAILTATDGEHFLIKQARTQNAATAIETEINALRSLGSEVRSQLPFNITNVVGETRDAYGKRAILFSFVYGNPIDLTTIAADDPLLTSIAGATAAIHNLPIDVVERAGLAQYTPQESIRLRVAELDRAAATGHVPPALLQRWETAFEDVSVFKYQPCVIHGDLNGDHMLEIGRQVSGLLNLSTLQIGDPAEDLSWVVGAHNPDAAYNVLIEYQRLRQTTDPFIRQRAQLYSELEIASWLLYGHRIKSEETIQDAIGLLQDLVSDLEAGALPHLGSTIAPTPIAEVEPTFTAPMPVVAASPDEQLPMPVIEAEGEVALFEEPVSEAPVFEEPMFEESTLNFVFQNDESDADEPIAFEKDPAIESTALNKYAQELPAYFFTEEEPKKDNDLF